ncbi:MAG: nucleotidyltransferase domain-containing protein [Spirochaetales bacterium]|nr:nucleotidyltransferase domain-containing protein [Spirochaetales bacterium]
MRQVIDVSAYANRLNRENDKYDKEMARRRREAKDEAERIASLLRSQDPEITQIWGFGSVFEDSRPFSENSDIDLALEGGNYFKAFKIVERSSFKIDLIDITDKDDSFASLIRKHGKPLVSI